MTRLTDQVVIKLSDTLEDRERNLAHSFVHAMLCASDPYPLILKHLDPNTFQSPVHILAFGKASISMTHASIEALGDQFARATIIAPQHLCAQTQFKDKFVDLLQGNHPYPGPESIQSTQQLIAHARSIPHDHCVLVLISGGASAMLCSPAPESSTDDIIRLTTDLLNKGYSIHELNRERAKLDTIKSGGLAREINHAIHIKALVLSDVLGNDQSIIGSGPVDLPHVNHTMIGDHQSLINGACAWLAHQNIELLESPSTLDSQVQIEANTIAHTLISHTESGPLAIIAAGEPTVNTNGTSGAGGPMSEMGIALAHELRDAPFEWTMISYASDGVDGPHTNNTPSAGVIISSSMVQSPSVRTMLEKSLVDHDTRTLCDTLGASICTGPTGTNVNDIVIVIRWNTIDKDKRT